jgi:hypothetical protein
MASKVEDKKGNAIDEGDRVFTKFRGGKREGEVRSNVTSYNFFTKYLGRRNCDYRGRGKEGTCQKFSKR